MKTMANKTLLISVLMLGSVGVFSQEKKEKNKVRIKVEQEIDGKNKVYEKIIDGTNLSASEKDEVVNKFQDSVMATTKGKSHRVRIEVEDDAEGSKFEKNIDRQEVFERRKDDVIERRFERDNQNIEERRLNKKENDEEIIINERPRVRVYRKGGDGQEYDSDDFMKEFRWEMDGLRDNLKNIGKDLPRFDFKFDNPGEVLFLNGSTSSKTVKNLDVFPNKPNSETLNLRFYSPEKGDVNIRVMDLKGNVVAKEDIKDFSGDFIGQIKLEKQLKGTFFVMVSQGEDGSMKKLVLE